MHDLLVNELNFTGIITTDALDIFPYSAVPLASNPITRSEIYAPSTDALDMGATKDIPDKFVKAIKAGNHLLLVQDYASAQKEIINAVLIFFMLFSPFFCCLF